MDNGVTKFEADIKRLERVLSDKDTLTDALDKTVEMAQKLASDGIYTTGHLAESIKGTVEEGEGTMTAHIGTDVEYAPFVEFGTGPKGQANHEGTSPNVSVNYSSSPWYIPADKIDPARAEAYGWHSVNGFYIVYGQPAKPFLYPAIKDNEEDVAQKIVSEIEEALK